MKITTIVSTFLLAILTGKVFTATAQQKADNGASVEHECVESPHVRTGKGVVLLSGFMMLLAILPLPTNVTLSGVRCRTRHC